MENSKKNNRRKDSESSKNDSINNINNNIDLNNISLSMSLPINNNNSKNSKNNNNNNNNSELDGISIFTESGEFNKNVSYFCAIKNCKPRSLIRFNYVITILLYILAFAWQSMLFCLYLVCIYFVFFFHLF